MADFDDAWVNRYRAMSDTALERQVRRVLEYERKQGGVLDYSSQNLKEYLFAEYDRRKLEREMEFERRDFEMWRKREERRISEQDTASYFRDLTDVELSRRIKEYLENFTAHSPVVSDALRKYSQALFAEHSRRVLGPKTERTDSMAMSDFDTDAYSEVSNGELESTIREQELHVAKIKRTLIHAEDALARMRAALERKQPKEVILVDPRYMDVPDLLVRLGLTGSRADALLKIGRHAVWIDHLLVTSNNTSWPIRDVENKVVKVDNRSAIVRFKKS